MPTSSPDWQPARQPGPIGPPPTGPLSPAPRPGRWQGRPSVGSRLGQPSRPLRRRRSRRSKRRRPPPVPLQRFASCWRPSGSGGISPAAAGRRSAGRPGWSTPRPAPPARLPSWPSSSFPSRGSTMPRSFRAIGRPFAASIPGRSRPSRRAGGRKPSSGRGPAGWPRCWRRATSPRWGRPTPSARSSSRAGEWSSSRIRCTPRLSRSIGRPSRRCSMPASWRSCPAGRTRPASWWLLPP